ncbi:MAG: YggS family pyridoxal phosphate-dependent enzyme, partial [Luteolibacter sp.]
MSGIAENLGKVADRIEAACARAGRDPATVELIAVSKTCPVDSLREAVDAGQLQFGESKLQEAECKITLLPSHVRWHFIGRLQRNKVRKLLPQFAVIHAIDSFRIAAFTDEVARESGLFPKVFLQVNVGGEVSKGGFEPDELRSEIGGLLALKRLETMGLMCIPPAGSNAEAARPWFIMLRNLRDELEADNGVFLPFLSMGMSDDYEVAI